MLTWYKKYPPCGYRLNAHIITFLLAGIILCFNPAFASGSGEQISLPGSNQCIVCHESLAGAPGIPVQKIHDDIHSQFGLFCQDCHGGDPGQKDKSLAKSAKTGYKGKPSHRDIPEFCNRCHGDENFMKQYNPNIRVDQYERYVTSTHGKRLLQGDEKVAVCTNCHQTHSIRSHSNIGAWTYPAQIAQTCGKCHSDSEYMKEYNIPTDQAENYQHSIHHDYLVEQGDMSAPTCNDCHGNHSAAPPGVTNVAFVCGTCHAQNETQFQKSTHNEYFSMLGKSGCTTCHDNHRTIRVTEEGLDLENGQYCGQCHYPDDEPGQAIISIKSRLDSLRTGYETADSLIQAVEQKGMDVNESKFLLRQAMTVLTRTRNTIHSFSIDEITDTSSEGFSLLQTVHDAGKSALREIRVRRIGLALSLLFIIFFCSVLYLKIKELKRRESNRSSYQVTER